MIYKLIIILSYFTMNSTQIKIKIQTYSDFEKKLVQFIEDHDMTAMYHRGGSRVVVLDGSDLATKVFEMMVKRIPFPTIVTKLGSFYRQENSIPSVIFLLLENENEIENAIDHVRHDKDNQLEIPTVMIKLSKVEDEKSFDSVSIMKSAWNMGVHRFLLIYCDDKMKAISYNPFTSKIIDVSHKTSDELFPDHLNKSQGFVWKVSLFEEWPLVKKDHNIPKGINQWLGRDVLLLNPVARIMNASVEVIEPPANTGYLGARKDIIDGKADFCFVRKFWTIQKNENFSFIDTGSISLLSVIVPKPPVYKKPTSIFKVFGKRTWIFLTLTAVVMILIITKFTMRKHNNYRIINVCSDIWRIALNIPLNATARNKYANTIPLLTWILASLVLTASFQCRLIDLMKYPEIKKGIETLKDLEESKLPVYSYIDYVKMQGKRGYLRKQMHLVSHEELLKKLDDPNTQGAVALPFIKIRDGTTFEFQEYLESRNKTILSESLIKSYGYFTFRKFSPFMNPIRRAIIVQLEYGLMAKAPKSLSWAVKVGKSKGDRFSIKIRHVLSAFHFIGIGLLVSLVIFVLEFFQRKLKGMYNKIFPFKT